jgi:hypothetical protein
MFMKILIVALALGAATAHADCLIGSVRADPVLAEYVDICYGPLDQVGELGGSWEPVTSCPFGATRGVAMNSDQGLLAVV